MPTESTSKFGNQFTKITPSFKKTPVNLNDREEPMKIMPKKGEGFLNLKES